MAANNHIRRNNFKNNNKSDNINNSIISTKMEIILRKTQNVKKKLKEWKN